MTRHLKIELYAWRDDWMCDTDPRRPDFAWWNDALPKEADCRPCGGGSNHRPEHEEFQRYLEESES